MLFNPPLVLASGSRIRREILEKAGIDFELIKSLDSAEPAPEKAEEPEPYVLRAAQAKALDVSSRHPNRIVLGADQVVSFKGALLRKVNSRLEAEERLLSFSNTEHKLVSGWCLAAKQGVLDSGLHVVSLEMQNYDLDEVRRYLDKEDTLSSVACYFLEGAGIRLVKSMKGSFFSALGLPLLDVMDALRRLKISF